MIESATSIFSAFGLSASAGLNAYLPLLIVALVARWTDWIKLNPPFDLLTSPWVIAVLVVLLVIETFADKIPAINHANDLIQTFIRPTARAILFAASTGTIGQAHPILMLILGLLVSGTVHTAKSVVVRPAVTATTGGVGNVPISIAEDIVAAVVSLLAVLLPPLIIGVTIVLTAFFLWLIWRRSSRPAKAQ